MAVESVGVSSESLKPLMKDGKVCPSFRDFEICLPAVWSTEIAHMDKKIGQRRRPKFFRSGHAYADIEALLSNIESKGYCLDLPCGGGVNLKGIKNAGFEPIAVDLYPEEAAGDEVRSIKASFTRPLPFKDESFAAVLCSEGIEHCSTQLQLLREFGRVLKPNGTLILTTPNILNLRARLSYMLTGHYSFKRDPISEVIQKRSEMESGDIYIGHVCLVTYFALRFMLKLAGFSRIAVTTAKYSLSAVCLAPFLWLPARLVEARLLRKTLQKTYPQICAEIISHTMSADMLFGKKLIICADKENTNEAGKDRCPT